MWVYTQNNFPKKLQFILLHLILKFYLNHSEWKLFQECFIPHYFLSMSIMNAIEPFQVDLSSLWFVLLNYFSMCRCLPLHKIRMIGFKSSGVNFVAFPITSFIIRPCMSYQVFILTFCLF